MDARDFVAVGDELYLMYRELCTFATVIKVTRCFVTYEDSHGQVKRGKAQRMTKSIYIGNPPSSVSFWIKDIKKTF